MLSEGKLTSSKWASIAKCSPDTALRYINDLVVRGVLRKTDAGGRSTGYLLSDLPRNPHPPNINTHAAGAKPSAGSAPCARRPWKAQNSAFTKP